MSTGKRNRYDNPNRYDKPGKRATKAAAKSLQRERRSAAWPQRGRQPPLKASQVDPATVTPVVRPLAVNEAVPQRPDPSTPPAVLTRPPARGPDADAEDSGKVMHRQELQAHDADAKRDG